MVRGEGAKNAKLIFNWEHFDDFEKLSRRIIYLEIIAPRSYSTKDGAVMHFYLLDGQKLHEYELKYSDNKNAYDEISRMLDHYAVADMFRAYRFRIVGCTVRILMRKGVLFDANGDLGGFVFQNYKASHLISPKRREIFDRLRKDIYGHIDGTAQLVKLGRLLDNEKFLAIHNNFFGKLGVATLNDSSTMKNRYADCLLSNNIITDVEQFGEYLAEVNSISMSDFTDQSIISQMSGDPLKIKSILTSNYSNFLFVDEEEIDFACVLLARFLCPDEFETSMQDWAEAVSYQRCLSGDSHLRLDENSVNFERELLIYRACYVFDNVDIAKLVHFFYDFFEYKNLSRNIGAFYGRLNDLLGEDIREKFLHLETINVSLKSYTESKDPCSFFKYPQLVNFSTAADKQIREEIIAGKYNRDFVAYYLCNYMQVADYKKYSFILPAVVSILKNLKIRENEDYDMFWMSCDLLNSFWKLLPAEDLALESEVEKLVYSLFWPRIGDVWPIVNRNRIKYANDAEKDEFEEALGWILCLGGTEYYGPELRDFLNNYSTKEYAIEDNVENKCHDIWFSKQKSKNINEYIESTDAKLSSVYYNAIFCKDIDNIELFNYLLDSDETTDDEGYAMEQLFLQFKSLEASKKLYDAILASYDRLVEFYSRLSENDKAMRVRLFNGFAALCESAMGNEEQKCLKLLSKKIADSLGKEYEDRIAKMLDVADAHIRQVNFQTKDITPDFVGGLR